MLHGGSRADRTGRARRLAVMLDWGRELMRDLALAESREWLCTNGIGGFASGTVAGTLTRRYHGLLVAALAPPLGRTLLVAKLDETVECRGQTWALGVNRWASGAIDPRGHLLLERFRLDGTVPVWTYACADGRLEKQVWMEQGANTTYVRYENRSAGVSLTLRLKALVNYRVYHGTTGGGDWRMTVDAIPSGVRVTAFAGARPFVIVAGGVQVETAHEWYEGFRLPREEERGLDAVEDHLHVATLAVSLPAGAAVTVTLSSEDASGLDPAGARGRRRRHEADLLAAWRAAQPAAEEAPPWIERLVLAADQFVVERPIEGMADGRSVIAGYHWFGDWGRDTMISLPGLTVAAGRPDLARRILTTFARYEDRGMLPNRFPDRGEALADADYNTVDAALWYVEATRAYVAATGDDGTLRLLYPTLEKIVSGYRQGTRFGIAEDPADGLVRAGEPGVQLTWMDAKVGDWVVTPRIGKPVEISALWYNALCAMRAFAERLARSTAAWDAAIARTRAGFERFWNEAAGCCYDVIHGPGGVEAALRPNQIFAVSLPESPLPPDRQKRVVDACARWLLTSYGLRSLAPGEPAYRGRYEGGVVERDGAYHQGTVWGWLLGPFALAHFRVYRNADAAIGFLEPMRHHLGDYGLGSIAEIFDGNAPFAPRGCVAQAWSVAETLRAWLEIASARRARRESEGRPGPWRARPGDAPPGAGGVSQG